MFFYYLLSTNATFKSWIKAGSPVRGDMDDVSVWKRDIKCSASMPWPCWRGSGTREGGTEKQAPSLPLHQGILRAAGSLFDVTSAFYLLT